MQNCTKHSYIAFMTHDTFLPGLVCIILRVGVHKLTNIPNKRTLFGIQNDPGRVDVETNSAGTTAAKNHRPGLQECADEERSIKVIRPMVAEEGYKTLSTSTNNYMEGSSKQTFMKAKANPSKYEEKEARQPQPKFTLGGADDGTTQISSTPSSVNKHIRNQRRTTIENYLLPTSGLDVGEEEDEDSTTQLGAFAVERRLPLPSDTTQQEDVGDDAVTSQPELHDNPEDVAIQDAYLVEQGGSRRQRTRNTNLVPELLEGNIERKSKNYMTWIAFFLVIVLAATLVTFMVLFLNKKKDDDDDEPLDDISLFPTESSIIPLPTNTPSVTPPSAAPSTTPTVSLAPTSERFALILDEVRRQFISPTLEADLQSPSSPQYKAALWMAEEDASDITLGLVFPFADNDFYSISQFRQRYALTVLYYSTNGESWLERCNFLDETLDVCGWKCDWDAVAEGNPVLEDYIAGDNQWLDYMGVNCDSEATIPWVVGIEFVFNNLSGTLPEELQGLDGLESLHLPDNNIHGTIPFLAFKNTIFFRELGVVALGYLSLYGNQLTGSIHEVIGEFANLFFISLENNLLTGQIPSELARDNLYSLDLGSNMLSGTIPTDIFQMEQLLFLGLGKNNLFGTLPDVIRLPSLLVMFLGENSISGSIPDAIGTLTSLEGFLDLSKNRLTGTILPSSMQKLTSLERIRLDNNQLTGKALNWQILGEMKNLVTLSLGDNHISGTIPTNIGELGRLSVLSVGHFSALATRTSITGTLPVELGRLQMLGAISVSGNDMSGTIPAELGNLSLLRQLSLDYNNFHGTIPTELNKLSNLNTLRVEQTDLVGDLTALCDNLPETDNHLRTGFRADCLEEEEVSCCCCNVCCDNSGICEDNVDPCS